MPMQPDRERPSRLPGDERGAAAVTTVCLVVILGCAALAVDLGMLLDSRAEAQRTADAAALAGASAFMPPPVPYAEQPDTARARALAYVQMNPVQGSPIPGEDVAVTVNMDSSIVRVSLRRRGLRAWLAAVLGNQTMEVSARAAAWVATSGRAACLKPFILADGWDDRDGNGVWSTGDAYDPAVTGWGSRFRNDDGRGYINDVGRPVVLERGQFDVPTQTGWYQPIRLDNKAGGNDIRQQIRSRMCNSTEVQVDDSIQGDLGASVGPVLQGLQELIDLDPAAHWQDGRIVGSAYGYNGDGSNSPRIINLPLMDPSQGVRSGQRNFQATNFAAVFLERVDQNGPESKQAIYGRWLTLRGIPDDCRDRGSCRPTLLYLRLIE